ESSESEISEDEAEEKEEDKPGAATFSTYASGSWDGSSMTTPDMVGSTYQIGTAAELKWFQNEVTVKGNSTIRGALTANIDLKSYNWTPIGTESNQFKGIFDGGNHTISNLSIVDSSGSTSSAHFGLFGYLGGSAVVKNLTVNGRFNIYRMKCFAGGIAGRCKGESASVYPTISNCVNNVNIEVSAEQYDSNSTSHSVGGIVGHVSYGALEKCINNGNITGLRNVGGITSQITYRGTIENCKNTGNISGQSAGGIMGFGDPFSTSYCLITKCYNLGDITGSSYSGGIAGAFPVNTTLTHCYNAGNLTMTLSSGFSDPIGRLTYFDYQDGNNVTLEDLWYLDTFEGTGEYGTARSMDELCKATEIEGFWPAHSGTPVLSWETALKHGAINGTIVAPTCTMGGGTLYQCISCNTFYWGHVVEAKGHSYDEGVMHPGYSVKTCSACGEVIREWNDERMPALDYDESIVNNKYFFNSDESDMEYPWILKDGVLMSTNKGKGNSESLLEIGFYLNQTGELSFDYAVSSEPKFDILTMRLTNNTSSPEIELAYDEIHGTVSKSFSQVLDPGQYFLVLNYKKDDSYNFDNDTATLSNFRLKPAVKGFAITEQPKSLESARVGSSISYHVTAENAASYQWQYSKDEKSWYNSGASSAKTDTLTLTLSTANGANKYRCKITDTQGTVHYTDTVWVKQVIADGFKITAQPQSVASAKFGDTITYKVTATGAASYQWQYSKDGKTWYNSGVASAKTNTMTLVLSTSNMNNKYRCAIKDNEGTVHYTNTVSVLKVDSFTITKQPSDWDVTKGKAASFSVTAQGASSYQWQYSKDRGKTWYKSSITPTLSSGTSTIKVNIAPSNAANIYRCKVTGKDGTVLCSGSAGFAGAPIVTAQPEDVVYQAGKAAVFTVTVSNPSICSFQWQYSKDGGKNWYNSGATGSKTKSLTLTMKESNLGMLYRCKITGKNNVYLFSDSVQMKK
ncbi:MAG: hypothetical protein Q4B85_13440, partial [Lachnospiraceae bacterium]|nr:hypothetical protein [Lachnospiraceae bacterium]